MPRSDYKRLLEEFAGPVQIAQFTASSDATALVPSAGYRLEILQIYVDAPDGQPTDTVRWTDGA